MTIITILFIVLKEFNEEQNDLTAIKLHVKLNTLYTLKQFYLNSVKPYALIYQLDDTNGALAIYGEPAA